MTPTPDDPRATSAHATPETPHLTVRGEAHLETAPETARIDITVSARGTNRHDTLADLTRRNTTTLDLIKTYADTVEHLETGTLTISPELTKHGRGERIRAYHGHIHLTAELADFTALGELTTRLADLELTRVDGPTWTLRPTSPAYRQARRQAVHDAVQRAREYAEALGTTLTALIELTDTDPTRPYPADRTLRTMTYAGETPDDTAPLDLEPQRQHIHAEVTARFTMAPPNL
ncbi:SIMPL domain-containing protein [Streptomyces sp. NPDC005907]|uniref:SIMPL domain-containing protein n=1 Tax=Streptomyces sp. NPDC005907 TaxID=3154571 RepID=UPI0033C7B2A6